jgi:hypothetical protein
VGGGAAGGLDCFAAGGAAGLAAGAAGPGFADALAAGTDFGSDFRCGTGLLTILAAGLARLSALRGAAEGALRDGALTDLACALVSFAAGLLAFAGALLLRRGAVEALDSFLTTLTLPQDRARRHAS